MKADQIHLEEIKRYMLDQSEEQRRAYAKRLLPGNNNIVSPGFFQHAVYAKKYSASSSTRMMQYHKKGSSKIPIDLADQIITTFFDSFYEIIKEAFDIEIVEEEPEMKKIHVMDLRFKYKTPIVEVGTLVYPKRVGELDDGKVIAASSEKIKIREKSGKHRTFTPEEFKEEYYT